MNNLIGFIYILISSLFIYFVIIRLLKHLKTGRFRILRYSLFPLLLILFSLLFSKFGLFEQIYRGLLIFFSSYSLIFLFLLSIMINIRGEKSNWRNILAIGILILIIALLHILGVIAPVLNFIKRPLITIADTHISLLDVFFAFIIFYLSIRYSQSIKELLEKRLQRFPAMDLGRINITSMIVRYLIIIIGIFIALSIVGIDLTTLKVLIGALGVGIGFGLQHMVNNLLSGFIILTDKSIVVNDLIEVDGLLGLVEAIGLRATIIRTFNNIEVIVPNSELVYNKVTNYTHSDNLIRIDIPIGISYSSDPNRVKEVLIKALSHLENRVEEPPIDVFFTNFGESSLDFTVLIWTDQPLKKKRIESEARFAIWKALKENDIEIPFPQRDIHIKNKESEVNS